MTTPDEWTPEEEEDWESNIDWDGLTPEEQDLLLEAAREYGD